MKKHYKAYVNGFHDAANLRTKLMEQTSPGVVEEVVHEFLKTYSAENKTVTLKSMTDVMQADIFFFIASVSTVIFLLLIALILFQIYKIVKLIRSVLERLESASEIVAEDAAHIRQLISSGGFFAGVIGLLSSIKRRSRKKTD